MATQKGDIKDGDTKQKGPEPDIKFWDQTPDGDRRPVPIEDAEERELRESIEREVKQMETETGQSVEEMVGVMTGDVKDVEEAMQRNMSRILEDGLGDMGMMDEHNKTIDDLEKDMDATRAVIESYGGIEGMRNLSQEERLKVREILLAPMRKAMGMFCQS